METRKSRQKHRRNDCGNGWGFEQDFSYVIRAEIHFTYLLEDHLQIVIHQQEYKQHHQVDDRIPESSHG